MTQDNSRTNYRSYGFKKGEIKPNHRRKFLFYLKIISTFSLLLSSIRNFFRRSMMPITDLQHLIGSKIGRR